MKFGFTKIMRAEESLIHRWPSIHESIGDFKASAFFCFLVGWADNGNCWTYKSFEEMKRQTGLTRNQLENARRVLKEHNLIDEMCCNPGRKMYFKINREKLKEILSRGGNEICPEPPLPMPSK